MQEKAISRLKEASRFSMIGLSSLGFESVKRILNALV